MSQSLRSWRVPALLSALLVLSGCPEKTIDPELVIKAVPRTINNKGEKTVITVTTADNKGKPGTGSVLVQSNVGSLKAGVDLSLADGTAETDFSCDVRTEPACVAGNVRVTVTWAYNGEDLTAATNITLTAIIPDAGVDLVSSTGSLGLTLGAVANLTATYVIDGQPQVGQPVAMTVTDAGLLLLPDGGAFTSPATTDSNGQVHAVLTDNGQVGVATVTATPPTGAADTVSINIYRPDGGITMSKNRDAVKLSLNDPATITVIHNIDGMPFPGRQLTLTTSAGVLLQLDGGTFVSPAATDSQGVIRALLAETGVADTAQVIATDPLLGTTASLAVPIQIPDGGMTLTADPVIKLTLGQRSQVLVVQSLEGLPRAGQPIALTATAGTLLELDGGAFVSPAATNASGEVRAILVEQQGLNTTTSTLRAADQWGRAVTSQVAFQAPTAALTIAAAPSLLTIGFNQSSRVTVQHTLEGNVVPGRQVALETTAGMLKLIDGGVFSSPMVTDGNGRIEAALVDTGTPGQATLTARDPNWGGQATTNVFITQPDAGLTLGVGKNRLYASLGDFTRVTARLTSNGVPSVGRNVQLTTSLGELVQVDGGIFLSPGVTDTNGLVEVVLRETGADGTANVTATDPMSGATQMVPVAIDSLGTLTFIDMKCNGVACTVLGLRNSGFNTSATLSFQLKDARNQVMPGVTLSFALNNAPAGTTTTATGVTDANGIAQAVVTTGNTIGSFTVTASVRQLQTTSQTFGVRGAKPANKGFTLQCERTNLSTYVATMPPAALATNCSVLLVDRNNNPIGTGTTVSFLTEAGSIPTSTPTQAYVPPNGLNEGRGSVSFSTTGLFPAMDVAPLTANAGAFPAPVFAEPSRPAGLLTRNPRDGLVTIIAYVDGEEWFSDSNSNGVRDPGEQFIDQGEPLVDSNDNDVWDNTENYIDVNGNGMWDGPNGVWEGSKKIWVKTAVLYTGATNSVSFNPSTPFDVQRNTQQFIDVWAPDLNMNRVEAGSTVMLSRANSSRGTVDISDNYIGLDGYGFVFDPMYLVGTGTAAGPCDATQTRCVYKTVFNTWSAGATARIRLTGATDMMDANPLVNDAITVSTTVRGVVGSGQISGTWH